MCRISTAVLCATLFLALACAPGSARAGNVFWSAGTADWTVGTNWNTLSAPGGSDIGYVGNGGTAQVGSVANTVNHAYIGHSGGTNNGDGTLELNTGGVLTVNNDVYVKLSANRNGTVNHNDGTFNIGNDLYFDNGGGTGQGIYNLLGGVLNFSPGGNLELRREGTFNWTAGSITGVNNVNVGATAGAFKSVFNLGGNTLNAGGLVLVGNGGGSVADEFNFQGGTVNTVGYFLMGGSSAVGGTAITLNAGDTLGTGTHLYVGNVASTAAVFNQNNGALTIGSNLIIANLAGSDGTFNLDAGTVTFGGTPGDIDIRYGGTFNWNAGSISNLNNVNVGSAAGAYKAVFNLNGKTLTPVGIVTVGNGGGSVADEFNFSGGTVNPAAYFLIGGSTAVGGTAVTLNAGDTLTTGTLLYVGNVAGTEAVFNQNDGALTIGTDLIISNVVGSQGTFNLDAGTVTFTNGSSDIDIRYGGTFNWNGGSLDRLDSVTQDVGQVKVGSAAGSDGSTFNLMGNTLNADFVTVGQGGGSALDQFNFQAGTVNTSVYFLLGGSTSPGGTTVDLSVGDTLTTGTHLYVGNLNAASARFRQNGGALTIGDDLIVSNTPTAVGTFIHNSGTTLLTGASSDLLLKRESNLVFNDGSLSGARYLRIGEIGDGTSTYTQNGGTVSINDLVLVGDAAGPEDFFNLNGGTFNLLNAAADFTMENDSTANIAGGTLNIARNMLVGTIASQTSSVNQSDGTVNVTGDVQLATVASSTGEYNLTGGELVVGGTLDLTNLGADTFVLNGGTLGATLIDDGDDVFDFQSGTVNPGGLDAIGATTFTAQASTLVIPLAGTLAFDLNGATTAGIDYDHLLLSGDIDITSGELAVVILTGFYPLATDSFEVLRALTITGTFSNAPSQLIMPDGGMFDVIYGTDGGFDTVVLTNYFPPVPEPSSFLLLGLGAIGLVRHTRRRRSKA